MKNLVQHHSHSNAEERRLARTHKNAVVTAIRQAGLDPAEFEWLKATSQSGEVQCITQQVVNVLHHRPTGSYFYFDGGTRSGSHHGMFGGGASSAPSEAVEIYYSIYHPGPQHPIHREQSKSWEDQLQTCIAWIQIVKHEAELPDLWSAVAEEATVFTGPEIKDEPFTLEEQRRLAVFLDEVEEYLAAHSPIVAADRARFHARFAYLKEALARLRKPDWISVVGNSLVGSAVDAGLDGLGFKEVVRFAGAGILKIIGDAVVTLSQSVIAHLTST